MTIQQKIQATIDTYRRKMAQPPEDSLYYCTLVQDAAGPVGVTMHSQRHFTEAHLPAYHPLHSLFDTHIKQRVIADHHNLRHIFQPTPTHHALRWPWRIKSPTTNHDPVPYCLSHIRSIPRCTASLNTTHTQRLIQHCLVHWILPQVTKNHTKSRYLSR